MALDWLVGHVCGDISSRLRTSLIESSEEIEAVAKQVVDRYWLAFRQKNKSQEHLPKDQRMLGRFAPFVRRHPLNQKLYIGWRDYAPRRKGTRGKVLGETLTPANKIHFKESQFSHKAKLWELQLIIKTEEELRQLRELSESIHKQLVDINKAERVYKWQKSQETSAIKPSETEMAKERSHQDGINPIDHM